MSMLKIGDKVFFKIKKKFHIGQIEEIYGEDAKVLYKNEIIILNLKLKDLYYIIGN